MAKNWVITLEPTDKSAPKRVVEKINGRKKIAEVEAHLMKLYQDLQSNDINDLSSAIERLSGVSTKLEKSPYLLYAELSAAS